MESSPRQISEDFHSFKPLTLWLEPPVQKRRPPKFIRKDGFQKLYFLGLIRLSLSIPLLFCGIWAYMAKTCLSATWYLAAMGFLHILSAAHGIGTGNLRRCRQVHSNTIQYSFCALLYPTAVTALIYELWCNQQADCQVHPNFKGLRICRTNRNATTVIICGLVLVTIIFILNLVAISVSKNTKLFAVEKKTTQMKYNATVEELIIFTSATTV